MPADTVCDSPNGLPIATTQSPTRTASESPSGVNGRFFSSTRSTATSVRGSWPTTLAFTWRLRPNTTKISLAPSITWLLVMTQAVRVIHEAAAHTLADHLPAPSEAAPLLQGLDEDDRRIGLGRQVSEGAGCLRARRRDHLHRGIHDRRAAHRQSTRR